MPRQRETLRSYLRALSADPCSYCGGPGGQRDHIEARARLARDGRPGTERDAWSNLTGACPECNEAKGTTPLLHYLLERVGVTWGRSRRR